MSETQTAQVAKRPATPVDQAKSFLQNPDFLSQLKLACTRHVTPERIARTALTAALGSGKLAECFTTVAGKASIAKALLTATQRGLEVDGRQAHLIPFKCRLKDGGYAMQAVYVPGYQGLIDLAYNHPNVVAIWAEAVYQRDTFEYRLGLNRELTHIQYDGDEDPGNLIAAYAVCEMRSGAKSFVVLRKREIDRIKTFSRGAAEPDSPWNTSPEAMWKKSAIRALMKFVPQSSELRDAIGDDEANTKTIDIQSELRPAKVKSGSESLLEGIGQTAEIPAPLEDDPLPEEPAQVQEPTPIPPPQEPPRKPRAKTTTLVETPLTPYERLDDLLKSCRDASVPDLLEAGIPRNWMPADCKAKVVTDLPLDIVEKLLGIRSAVALVLSAR